MNPFYYCLALARSQSSLGLLLIFKREAQGRAKGDGKEQREETTGRSCVLFFSFFFFLPFFSFYLEFSCYRVHSLNLTRKRQKQQEKNQIKEIKIANSHTYYLNLNCKPLSKSIENTTSLHLHIIFNC